MARVARIIAPGCPHHVTPRGNNRQGVGRARPLGEEGFVGRLEQLTGRRLTPGRPGRPKRTRPK